MAAPSSAQTNPSAITSSAPAIHPSSACGPPIAATNSGIVTNGPMPHICVMFTATAERSVSERLKWPSVDPACGS